jgi:scyllo-inositol 2-dehydrogenase (NADP+)
MSRSKVRFAVIGAGNITSLRHIPALRASGRAEIIGIIDRHADRAQDVAKRFNLPHWGNSLDEPWLEKAEAVTIGVPPAAHMEVARAALEAGKHVLLEKPMALNVNEAIEAVELAEAKGLMFGIVHNFQFARSAVKLQKMIASGKMGALKGILCFQTSTTERRLPVWHEELPLGLFFDEAPHLLYLLHAFGGKVELESVAVSKSTKGRVTPAVVTAHFKAGNVPAILYNNFEAPVSEWHFIVYGEKAMAAIDVFRDVLVVLPNDNQHLAADVMRTSGALLFTHLRGVFVSGLQMLRGKLLYGNEEVVRRFLDAIQTGVPPLGISGRDGLEVLKMQLAVVEAAQNGHANIMHKKSVNGT